MTTKRRGGVPTKRTPENLQKIVQAIKLGATYELAAAYAGMHYDTFNEWRKDDPDFSEAIKQAEGQAAVLLLAKIEQAATDGNWQAAAWKLERRYPKMYGRTVQEQEHSGELKVNVVYAKPIADTDTP